MDFASMNFENMRAPPSDNTRMISPVAGYVVKTQKTAAEAYESSGKVFINICSHESIERPCGAQGTQSAVDDNHLDNKGLGNLQLPLLVGPARKIEDNSGHPATAVDVIYHPSLVQRALHGSPQHPVEHFKGALTSLALRNVASEYNMQIEMKKVTFLERVRYKGSPGQNASNTHSFSVIADQPAAPEPTGKPDIQVIGEESKTKKKAKPIMKKGFFDKPNKFKEDEDAELYPDGSAEGVPKEGQQDPAMAWLPENVRNKCHIVDTRSLNQEGLDTTMKEYAETGKLNTEMPGVHKQGTAHLMKREAGLGHPSALRSPSASTADRPSTAPAPGKVKPEKVKPVPETMFKFVGQTEEPVHSVAETTMNGSEALCVTVQLPSINSITQVSLDMSDTILTVRGGNYRLKLTLPKRVLSSDVKAKFVAKRKELKVTAPVSDLD